MSPEKSSFQRPNKLIILYMFAVGQNQNTFEMRSRRQHFSWHQKRWDAARRTFLNVGTKTKFYIRREHFIFLFWHKIGLFSRWTGIIGIRKNEKAKRSLEERRAEEWRREEERGAQRTDGWMDGCYNRDWGGERGRWAGTGSASKCMRHQIYSKMHKCSLLRSNTHAHARTHAKHFISAVSLTTA